jgi:hypothetical protein
LKQAGEGIVGGGPLLFRRTSGRLRAGENLLGRDQEVNVVQVIPLGWIHWPDLLWPEGGSTGYHDGTERKTRPTA